MADLLMVDPAYARHVEGIMMTGGDHFEEPSVESWTVDRDTAYYIAVKWWSDGIEYDLGVDVSD